MIYSFRGTILRILSEVSGPDISSAASLSRHLTACQSLEQLREALTRIFTSICLLIRSEEDTKRSAFYTAILQYIRQQYSNPDLTLTSTADHFHVSEKYLSHFFKEAGGVNFSSAVEKIRMEEVVRYMAETELSITEICIHCGYSSSNSFYKAFKRVYSVSPNTYRKQLRLKS